MFRKFANLLKALAYKINPPEDEIMSAYYKLDSPKDEIKGVDKIGYVIPNFKKGS